MIRILQGLGATGRNGRVRLTPLQAHPNFFASARPLFLPVALLIPRALRNDSTGLECLKM